MFAGHKFWRITVQNTCLILFRFPCLMDLESWPYLEWASFNKREPSMRNTATSTSCFSLCSAKSRWAIIVFVVSSSAVWNNSFVPGSTAPYSQCCSSLSRINVSSTISWSGVHRVSGYKSVSWTQLWTPVVNRRSHTLDAKDIKKHSSIRKWKNSRWNYILSFNSSFGVASRYMNTRATILKSGPKPKYIIR